MATTGEENRAGEGEEWDKLRVTLRQKKNTMLAPYSNTEKIKEVRGFVLILETVTAMVNNLLRITFSLVL